MKVSYMLFLVIIFILKIKIETALYKKIKNAKNVNEVFYKLNSVENNLFNNRIFVTYTTYLRTHGYVE